MHQYQIAILRSEHASARDLLRDKIVEQLTTLGVEAGSYTFLTEKTLVSRDKKAITVAFYLGLSTDYPKADAVLLDLIADAVLVVPVVSALHDLASQLPDELLHLNALKWNFDEGSALRAANAALEALSLLRSTRRLFISYRRSETTNIAIQLFEFFESHGFDVFLDTHSVPVGAPFQDVLWHRLSDSDVIVVLDSPDFMNSFWTMAEVTRANLTSVEMVQMVWPGTDFMPEHALNHPFFLGRQDFIRFGYRMDQRLTDECLRRLITVVESVRARALAARHNYLVAEFIREADLRGLQPKLLSERFLTITTSSGKVIAAVPAVGVPDAKTCHDVEVRMGQHSAAHDDVVLLYDERGILAKWIAHLGWLNGYKLKVRSLQIGEAAAWLEAVA